MVELLQQLIRNACVNDGTATSGQEVRNAQLLRDYLEVPGIEVQSYEPIPGRTSLVARLGPATWSSRDSRAHDASATHRTLLLMGHTDVVPVDERLWQRDPFGAELVDGWLWGRGAVDMLNLTASMAVAMRRVARGTRYSRIAGDLVFLAVADEEALGTYGAKWLTDNRADDIRTDAVITESGGVPIATASGLKLPVIVAEKGSYWCRLTVSGEPGHGSRPFRTDNALVKAAEVVRRISQFRPEPVVPDAWRRFLRGLELGEDLERALCDPALIDATCASLPVGLAREAHSSTHTTFAPTVCHAGGKTNVIPGTAEIDIDIRSLPDQTAGEVEALLADALGDLAAEITITPLEVEEATSSPIETPLWECLRRAADSFYAGSAILPMLSVGATDARFFRRLGIASYGFGMFSQRMTIEQFAAMFHGNDERVDLESLVLSTEMWEAVARDYLS